MPDCDVWFHSTNNTSNNYRLFISTKTWKIQIGNGIYSLGPIVQIQKPIYISDQT